MSEQWSWAVIPSINELYRFYLSALAPIRAAARERGYAIGSHGSMLRDLDLIAVPWTDDYSDPDTLAGSIQLAACGLMLPRYKWEHKSPFRIGTTFPICWIDYEPKEPGLGHIDLSVFVPQPEPEGRTIVSEAILGGTPAIISVIDNYKPEPEGGE